MPRACPCTLPAARRTLQPRAPPRPRRRVNNCVGHGNLAAFMRMCVYLAAACLHATLLLLSMDAFLVQVGGRVAGSVGAG